MDLGEGEKKWAKVEVYWTNEEWNYTEEHIRPCKWANVEQTHIRPCEMGECAVPINRICVFVMKRESLGVCVLRCCSRIV